MLSLEELCAKVDALASELVGSEDLQMHSARAVLCMLHAFLQDGRAHEMRLAVRMFAEREIERLDKEEAKRRISH